MTKVTDSEASTDGQRLCLHENFNIQANVFRLTDDDKAGSPVTGYAADIKAECRDCSMPFQWLGDRGISTGRPMVSLDKLELRAPLVPLEES